MPDALQSTADLIVRKEKEIGTLFGYEAPNQYTITDPSERVVGYVRECPGGALARQLLKAKRSFSMRMLDSLGQTICNIYHPFCFYFHRFIVETVDEGPIGFINERFSFIRPIVDIADGQGRLLFKMDSTSSALWTFPIFRQGQEVAEVRKKWEGLANELLFDADTFGVSYKADNLTEKERLVILAASILMDISCFENGGR